MNNKGSLAFAFMLILILTALSAAMLLRSANEGKLAQRTTNSSAALWAAEAGQQKVLYEYNYNNCQGMLQQGTATACTSCASCGGGNKTLAGSLSGYGDYDVILNNASTTIQSVGSVPSRNASNVVQRRVQATISKPSIFAYGMFAQGKITVKQNALVDAYNSNNGAYGGANIDHINGNIGSNGTTAGIVEVDNNANVWGNASTGPGGGVTGGGIIHGAITNTNSIALPAVVVPSTLTSLVNGGTFTVTGTNASPTILSGGDYKYTNVSIGNNKALQVNGNVRLYLTGNASQISLDTGTAHINLTISSGATLVIYVDGKLKFDNNSTITSVSQTPSSLQIYSTYSGAGGVTINNNGTTYAAIYAPQTDVDISQNAGFFGAAVGNTVKLENNGEVHFDTALASMANPFENAIVANWQEY